MKDALADNRAELMDCALELFAAYGYDGVGVQNICEAAAVTKPTL
jgi:AcrR family transcriptional regulator